MTSEEASFDPRQRRLCPDGACVGLLGDDNRCKECGMPGDASGEPTAADSAAITWDGDDDASLPGTLGDVAGQDAGAGGSSAAGDFDPNRRLCSDGSCLGVIAADNRCNVCGRPGE